MTRRLHCLLTVALALVFVEAGMCLGADEKAKDAKAPARRRIVVATPAAAPAADDPMVQQWQNQFRPVMVSELNFVRLVCELTPEQRPPIRKAAEAGLRKAAVEHAKQQQGGFRANSLAQRASQEFIRDSIAEVVKQTLSPEQFAHYEKEAAARSEQRQRAAILTVVARLDGALGLTEQQRDKIVASLTEKWQSGWESWITITRYGEQYFPQLPDEVLLPHLDDGQKQVWNGLSKLNGGFYAGPIAQPVDDVAWWGGEAAPPVGPPEPLGVRRNAGEVILKAIGNLFGL